MESLTVTWPQRRMMVLQKKGKIMIWRNGQTTHPSLHLHLLAQETVRKLVSNENGHRLQLKRRARDRSMATRGLQGPGCLEALAWAGMPSRPMELTKGFTQTKTAVCCQTGLRPLQEGTASGYLQPWSRS